jgi:hypothetical protein
MNFIDARHLIDEINRLGYKANAWEIGFLRSVARQTTLSVKQGERLTEIYRKASGGGGYERRQVLG